MLLPQAVAIGAAAIGATAATTARVGDDGEVCGGDGGGGDGGGGDDGVSDLAGHAGPGRDRKRSAHCARALAATLLIITIQQLVAASIYLWAKLALLFSYFVP